MSDGITLDEFENDPPARDFRRANGAPMVKRIDDPSKWDRYSRPSGWGDALDEKSALVNWKIDRAIEGVACDPSIAATIVANLGIDEGAKERRERAIQRGRGEEAADIGTALHAMTARVELGDGFKAPPPYDADIAAYLMALDSIGLVSRYIECKLCSDIWRAAGTADRIFEATRELVLPGGAVLEPGQFVLGDLKTGKRKDYSIPAYVIQLALYVDSVFYDVDTHVRTPLPDGLRTDWGLVIRVPAGTAEVDLLWGDLEVGREGARIVQLVRHWRRREDFVHEATIPGDDSEAVLAELSLALPEPEPDHPEWVEMMLPFAQERINRIGAASNECRDLLLRRWPFNVPPLREATPTATQLTAILNLLDLVEAAFSLPFLPDPRVTLSAGLFKDEIERTNNPTSNGATQP